LDCDAADALVLYAEHLARQLDERPTLQVGREYRLTLALLLELGQVAEETAEEIAAHASFLRAVSTPGIRKCPRLGHFSESWTSSSETRTSAT
jgi:hypothetical protein